MTPTFEPVSATQAEDHALRDELFRLWVDVTDAGGAVGFTAPAPEPAIAATLDTALARVAEGADALGVVRSDGTVVAMGFLVDRGAPLCRHWRTVLRVMVHPAQQGTGAGRLLMEGLHDLGRGLGLEHLQLTIRDGHGLEGFYGRVGYSVVGRHPGAVRVASGDDRDEIMLVAPLTAATDRRSKPEGATVA